MNYVSEDLERIIFCTSLFGGYRKKPVDDAIQRILDDYREREKEITELKSKVSVMTETVEHYKTIEESMQHCLIIAQHTSDEMIKSANEKAKDIIFQADATSQKLVNDAYQQANKIKFSYDDIKAKIYSFKVKSEALLKSQLDVLGQLSGDQNE
jgi:cell division initiation protein